MSRSRISNYLEILSTYFTDLDYKILVWYSSKATWYPHTCCSLNIVGWRLHHAFNIRTGVRYVYTHIRQIVWCVHPRKLHYFVWTLNEHYNINSIYTMNLRRLSLYLLINPWIQCPSYWIAAHMQYISFPTIWLGVENGLFIGDWISINLFKFVQSVGWKVRKYQY